MWPFNWENGTVTLQKFYWCKQVTVTIQLPENLEESLVKNPPHTLVKAWVRIKAETVLEGCPAQVSTFLKKIWILNGITKDHHHCLQIKPGGNISALRPHSSKRVKNQLWRKLIFKKRKFFSLLYPISLLLFYVQYLESG